MRKGQPLRVSSSPKTTSWLSHHKRKFNFQQDLL
jgi:hypothetical protein